jgi:hypothetical protein
MKRTAKVYVTVKCVGCGHRQDVKPGQVEASDVPMCERCFMPMVPESATRIEKGE